MADTPDTWNLIRSNNLAEFWFVEVLEDGTLSGVIDGSALCGYLKDEWTRERLVDHLVAERQAEHQAELESIKRVEDSWK